MKLPALEKNILKYRAIEMTIILFHAENLKNFITNSIRATDELRHRLYKRPQRLPVGTKKVLQKAFEILVLDGILTGDESDELQTLIGYRNDIAHRMHLLTADIVHLGRPDERLRQLKLKYRYDALGKFERYRNKIERGLRSRYVLPLSFDGLFFENAEQTYKEELQRLRNRINRQFEIRKRQIANRRTRTSREKIADSTEPSSSSGSE